jgi:two-component system, OmpR family, sensor histidine kinase KdpD
LSDRMLAGSIATGVRSAKAGPSISQLDVLAHDMREHLTSIILAAKTSLAQGTSLSESDRAELAHVCVRHAEQLETMVQEIMDLRRLDEGAWIVYRQMTDVRTLIDSLVSGFDLKNRPLLISGDGPPVDIDPGLMKRIIQNLVGNAKAHTPSGSPISITTQSDDRGAHVVVEDAGPGVPDEMKTIIFEAFRSGKRHHTGLGLALVQRFCEAHGGKAWVEDGAGGGARFFVDLPGAMGSRDSEITIDQRSTGN